MLCAACGNPRYSSELSYSNKWRNENLNVKLNYRCRVSGIVTQRPVCLSCVMHHNREAKNIDADCGVARVYHPDQVDQLKNEQFQRDLIKAAFARMEFESSYALQYDPMDWWISLK